jgi:hypothetical protein
MMVQFLIENHLVALLVGAWIETKFAGRSGKHWSG